MNFISEKRSYLPGLGGNACTKESICQMFVFAKMV